MIEAAGGSKDGQPVQAPVEDGLGKVEDQSGKANAGTEESEAGTGKTEVKAAYVRKAIKPYHSMTIEVLQINLHQCKAACQLLSRWLQKVQTQI